MVVQPCEYTENHWIGHFKTVTFTAYELYLKKMKKWDKVKDISEALSDYLNGFDRKSISSPSQDMWVCIKVRKHSVVCILQFFCHFLLFTLNPWATRQLSFLVSFFFFLGRNGTESATGHSVRRKYFNLSLVWCTHRIRMFLILKECCFNFKI